MLTQSNRLNQDSLSLKIHIDLDSDVTLYFHLNIRFYVDKIL